MFAKIPAVTTSYHSYGEVFFSVHLHLHNSSKQVIYFLHVIKMNWLVLERTMLICEMRNKA